jgi:hypothetical protein
LEAEAPPCNPNTGFATLGSGFTYVTSALAAPASLLATATSTTSVDVSCNAFTDPSVTGMKVKAVHLTELRTALNAARVDLVLSSLSFTNTLTAGVTPVRAIDFTELRNGVK